MVFRCIAEASSKSQQNGGPVPNVCVYRCSVTGLTVVMSPIQGPLVNGVFALATESNRDDGCPHTLEHLIFLGSEDYPYKGILDELANRNMSQGTNAWTATDHTAYTLTTAGSEGFLALLPVYLDHILFPTITDAGFVTEVHHITESGQNAGVVYCEMQARENTCASRTSLALHRLCYPKHGYSSETGGLLHDIRELTADTIRQYHSQHYRPENLCLIITGMVNREELFTVLTPFIDKVCRKFGAVTSPERSWRQSVPPLQTTEQVVYFPTDDESVGTVTVAWTGPKWGNLKQKLALTLLWRYLSESPLAPLQKALIECDEPLCANIDAGLNEFSTTLLHVSFTDANTETVDQVAPRMFEVLKSIQRDPTTFDIERMRRLVGKSIREFYVTLEEQAHEFLAGKSIEVFLYGDASDISSELQADSLLLELQAATTNFWISILNDSIIDAPHVTVIGRPSSGLSVDMDRFECKRIEEQISHLGPGGLASCGAKLALAEQANAVPSPVSLLESFIVPDISKVELVPLVSASNVGFETSHLSKQLSSLPFSLICDSIPTRFVELTTICSTETLPLEQRFLLELYAELIFESDVRLFPGNNVIALHDVITMLDQQAVSWVAHTGSSSSPFSCGSFSQSFQLGLKFPETTYTTAVNWMRTFMTGVVFNPDRIRIVCTRLHSSIASLKRKGNRIAVAAIHVENYEMTSNHVTTSMFQQDRFLSRVLSDLDSAPDSVVAELVKLQNYLSSNAMFHVSLDVTRHEEIVEPWRAAFEGLPITKMALPFPFSNRYLLSCKSPGEGRAPVAIVVAGLETSYLYQTGAVLPASFDAECVPAVRLALEYITACEGPLWKRIRGAGYSYSYGLSADFESGLMVCTLFKATNVVAAYGEARNVVRELVSGGTSAISDVALQAARSSLSFEIVSSRDNAFSAAREHLDDSLRGLGSDYQKCLLKKVQHVTKEELLTVLSRYVMPSFEAPHNRLVIVTGTTFVSDICTGFKEFGISLVQTEPDAYFNH